jgi:hypothetical protein
MKIEIEWNCSHEATIRISGRVLAVSMRPGVTSLKGVKEPETSLTLGGLIARELYGKVGDIMQAHAIAEEDMSPDGSRDVTWMRMSDHLAAAVESRLS